MDSSPRSHSFAIHRTFFRFRVRMHSYSLIILTERSLFRDSTQSGILRPGPLQAQVLYRWAKRILSPMPARRTLSRKTRAGRANRPDRGHPAETGPGNPNCGNARPLAGGAGNGAVPPVRFQRRTTARDARRPGPISPTRHSGRSTRWSAYKAFRIRGPVASPCRGLCMARRCLSC